MLHARVHSGIGGSVRMGSEPERVQTVHRGSLEAPVNLRLMVRGQIHVTEVTVDEPVAGCRRLHRGVVLRGPPILGVRIRSRL